MGSPTYYNLWWSAAVAKWCEQQDKSNWYVSEMAPTEDTVFQGEVFQSERGLDLYYSTEPKTMRDGLGCIKTPLSNQVFGTMANLFLQHYVDPLSLEWIHELLRRYEGHVIEFSTYNKCCGLLNMRTIIWEVRGGY